MRLKLSMNRREKAEINEDNSYAGNGYDSNGYADKGVTVTEVINY